jgi:HEAT repeat protein
MPGAHFIAGVIICGSNRDFPVKVEVTSMSRQTSRGSSKLDPTRLHELFESDSESDWLAAERLIKRSPTAQLVAALNNSQDVIIRRALCHALGRRCDSEAVPALIECLRDPDGILCTEAAEALGNIGDRLAGSALFERFSEPDNCSENLLAYALGAVGYRRAIPALTQALADPDVRESAAIALGSLGAVEAKVAMQEALRAETSESARSLIERGLAAISVVEDALRAEDIDAAMPAISRALKSRDILLRLAAVRAMELLGGKQAEVLLRNISGAAPRDCSLEKRIREALELITQGE